MQRKTVKQLNRLNNDFYKKVANSFSDTRKYSWEGFERVLKFLPKKKHLKVLDVGCGNGRFGKFLLDQVKVDYVGLDNNQDLLKQAKETLGTNSRVGVDLVKLDLIEELKDVSKLGKFDLVTVFGVLHHIPSKDLRKKMIKKLIDLLTDDGIIVITVWNFGEKKRFFDRLVPLERVRSTTRLDVDENDLEKGDVFLGWQNREDVVRYCHSFSNQEIKDLLEQFLVVGSFKADGKSGDLNTYFVLKKLF